MLNWTLLFVSPVRLFPTSFQSEIETTRSPKACRWRVRAAAGFVDTALYNNPAISQT